MSDYLIRVVLVSELPRENIGNGKRIQLLDGALSAARYLRILVCGSVEVNASHQGGEGSPMPNLDWGL